MDGDALVQAVTGIAPGSEKREKINRPAVRVPVERLGALAVRLRDDPRFGFDLLLDHMAIDLVAEKRFELIYHLYSTSHGHALTVTTYVPRDTPVAPTMSRVWPIAEWQEREVYDLLGVLYDEHPDLRRLFLEDDWKGFPLRKDYQDPDMLEFPK
jgi:NADH-quinone oxidoreductase subunit C